MRLGKLYEKLKELVHDGVTITLRDNVWNWDKRLRVDVCLQLSHDKYHWVVFRAETLEQAIRKAVDKLRHPNKDYVDENGKVWKANETSVYSTENIKAFLRNRS